jgi:hypothetical protein
MHAVVLEHDRGVGAFERRRKRVADRLSEPEAPRMAVEVDADFRAPLEVADELVLPACDGGVVGVVHERGHALDAVFHKAVDDRQRVVRPVVEQQDDLGVHAFMTGWA